MIKVKELSKTYEYYEKNLGLKGSASNLFHRKKLHREAVKSFSFEINDGEFVAFLGPNGSGKTTTMKMLSGILYPTSGSAEVMGYVPWERKKAFSSTSQLLWGKRVNYGETYRQMKCCILTNVYTRLRISPITKLSMN
jgi:ABC-2 type transport system ATP-binding protein